MLSTALVFGFIGFRKHGSITYNKVVMQVSFDLSHVLITLDL